MDMEFRDLVARCGILSICRRLYGQALYLLSDVLAEADILLMEVPMKSSAGPSSPGALPVPTAS